MATIFYVQKKSGTYADTLEAYGLGNLLNKISNALNISKSKGIIIDKGGYYEIQNSFDITNNEIEQIPFFYLFRFIIKAYDKIPTWVDKSICYDYPLNKKVKDERREQENSIRNNTKLASEQMLLQLKTLKDTYDSPQAFQIDLEYDVYNELRKNSYDYFTNKFEILHGNKDEKYFHALLTEILNYYSIYHSDIVNSSIEAKVNKALSKSNIKITDNSNAQIINPNHGQGVFKSKSNGLNRINPPTYWVSELMKIAGALDSNCMICKQIAIGSKYDLKVYVPEINQAEIHWIKNFIQDFKTNLKSNTPIRIDILNLLHLCKKFIEKSPNYIGEIHNTIKGLHVVYQKQLSSDKTKPRTVLNISFVTTPLFIKIESEDDAYDWLDVLNEQISIISNIGRKGGKLLEDGAAIQGLSLYRNFLSGSNINSFFNFSFWYAQYIISQFSKGDFVKLFSIETLNKFYKNMETNELKLSEIISNEGFKAVANAIRESTVVLQTISSLKKQGKAKETQLKKLNAYSIRYGLAQTLQSKSKSTKDLAEFIGDFISLYNSETARQAEKSGKSFRAIVRDNELTEFYILVDNDKLSSNLIGALLSSYGFALLKKQARKQDEPEQTIDEPIED